MAERAYWVECGNCGEALPGFNLASLLLVFAEHMDFHHHGVTWHRPRVSLADVVTETRH